MRERPGRETLLVVLLSTLLLSAILWLAVGEGLLLKGRGPAPVERGVGYTHWSEVPWIEGPRDVPAEYYGPSLNRSYAYQSSRWSYGLRSNVSVWYTGYLYRIPGIRIRTNRFGFRDDPMDRSAPSGTLRIFAVGASGTMGQAVNGSETWPEQLERMLRGRLDRRVQVVNAGVPGLGIRGMYGMITERVVAMDPDLVVVAFMRNHDLSEQRTEQIVHRLRRRHPNMSRQELLELERRTVRRYITNTTERWDQNQSDLRQYLPRIDAVLQERGVPTVLYPYRGLNEPLRQRIERLAARRDLTVIGPHPVIGDHTARYTVLPQDGHLGPAGYHLVAQHLLEELAARYDLARLGRDRRERG